jgi:hypothetical protein
LEGLRNKNRDCLRQLHVDAALVQPKLPAISWEPKANAVFGRAAFVIDQKRAVDQLDEDFISLSSCAAAMGSAKGRESAESKIELV